RASVRLSTCALTLHDARPISPSRGCSASRGSATSPTPSRTATGGSRSSGADLAEQPAHRAGRLVEVGAEHHVPGTGHHLAPQAPDRKSTRLNSSHVKISYAVL